MMREPAIPTIRGIPELVAVQFRITVGELLSPCRDRRVARPRQVAMWLARRVAMASLAEIARYFERDHTTVMHAVRRVDALMAAGPGFAADVLELARRIDADEAASLRRTMMRRVA